MDTLRYLAFVLICQIGQELQRSEIDPRLYFFSFFYQAADQLFFVAFSTEG
jgi:hypothetical protein